MIRWMFFFHKDEQLHHKRKTFQQEYDEFFTKCKFQKFKD
jgi:hypothetical protein